MPEKQKNVTYLLRSILPFILFSIFLSLSVLLLLHFCPIIIQFIVNDVHYIYMQAALVLLPLTLTILFSLSISLTPTHLSLPLSLPHSASRWAHILITLQPRRRTKWTKCSELLFVLFVFVFLVCGEEEYPIFLFCCSTNFEFGQLLLLAQAQKTSYICYSSFVQKVKLNELKKMLKNCCWGKVFKMRKLWS